MEIKVMSMVQYEKYLDFIDEFTEKVNKKEISARKFGFELAKWVVKEVYGLEAETMRPGTLFDLSNKTVELTEKSEIEDEKNSEKSGTGE